MEATTICMGCGAETRLVEHQTRAADEPQTIIRTCSNCPVDPSKLSGQCSPPKLPLRHRVTHTRGLSSTLGITPMETFRQMVLDVPVFGDCINDFPNPTTQYRTSVYAGSKLHGSIIREIETYHHTGLNSRCSTREYQRNDLGFGIRLLHLNVTRFAPAEHPSQFMDEGVVREFQLTPSLPAFVYRVAGTTYVSVDCTACGWNVALRAVLTRSYCMPSLQYVINKSAIATLRNISPRAWDHPIGELEDHLYTAKVDGERSWCVLDSDIALCFKHGGSRYTWGWFILDPPIQSKAPVVIDVEYCGPHGIFFIDMLTSADGTYASPSRTMTHSLEQLRLLDPKRRGLPIRVRSYSTTLAQAMERMKLLPYPADGIIAIHKSGTTAKKLKSVRSVELRVHGDGALYTEDGKLALRKFTPPIPLSTGDIIEVRFRESKSSGKITITEMFRRVDKVTANDSAAFTSILTSLSTKTHKNDEDRRAALMWCNSLRRHLFRMALTADPNKKIILNIGAGSGQSLDELSHDSSVSIVHIEPDAENCRRLAIRGSYGKVMTSPRELLSCIRSLKTRAMTGCVINCTLQDLMLDDEVCLALVKELRAAIATFSAHFVYDEIQHMVSHWNVRIYGCLYAYDNVEVGQVLVDSCGVKMARTSQDVCSVRWGSDTDYTEPYTTTQFYSHCCTVSRGVDIIGYSAGTPIHISNEICKRVIVLTP